ncbi:alpha/beta hydrolase [Aliidiomarina iranensis]|uniref:Alpha/beta hydrolase n=1 Tax=Aliidiomarina iranensis TaxID=1434071 RepID=A0A432VZM9_9GAMM|nr:alpha/beta fold hydrolase [Aliidiomarina iranensis]RUO22207.1 alpha/beta hydrolase [Aliidiomarina iranensis]
MADAIQLNYEITTAKESTADTVVLIHGLFGDLDNLKSISRALQSAYHVVNIDLRNHGESPWCETMTFMEMAADIEALLDKLEISKAHILGHSLGGKVAMEFALEHPDRVHSLIIADIAPVAYEPSHNSILDALEALDISAIKSRQEADKALADAISEKGVRQFLLKNLYKENNKWQWRMNIEGLRNCYEDLIGEPAQQGQFDAPVLFIRGGDSDYIQAEHRDAILNRFPQAESKTINGTGHWLHAEKPAVFNGLVERFLEENFGSEVTNS